MKNLVQETADLICREKLILPGQRVLAGISGGADSTALLLVLKELSEPMSFSLEAVHVEHGIRGEESLGDEAFVSRLCAAEKIPLHIRRVNVPARAEKKGESLEEAARNARFEIFEEIRRERGADRIALAHHGGDQTETVLLNLCRGTGLAGLAGISPVKGRMIHPFLCVTREQIEGWLRQQGREWRTDSTNLKTDQTRNRIRLEVLPLLRERINSAADRHIREAALIVRSAMEHLEKECAKQEENKVFYRAGGMEAGIGCDAIDSLDDAVAAALIRRMIGKVNGEKGLKDFSLCHINDIRSLARKEGGKKIDLPGEIEAVRQGGEIVIRHRQEKLSVPSALILPDVGKAQFTFREFEVKMKYLDGGPVRRLLKEGIPEKKYTKWLACDTMIDAVCLRGRKTGDYLVINAAGGRKSLQDYLVDEKIPARERDGVVLVAQGSHVLWVVGHRISYAARVGEKTRKALQISVSKEEPCLRM